MQLIYKNNNNHIYFTLTPKLGQRGVFLYSSYVLVSSGMTLSDKYLSGISAGMSMSVYYNGVAIRPTISGFSAQVSVLSGGTAISAIVVSSSWQTGSAGCLIVYSGGTAMHTTIGSGAYRCYIYGGTDINPTVFGSCSNVGGIASNIYISYGSYQITSGGTAVNITIVGSNGYGGGGLGINSYGTAISTTISGGSLVVNNYGTAISTTLKPNAEFVVGNYGGVGGTAISTIVSSGARFYVSHGRASYVTQYLGGALGAAVPGAYIQYGSGQYGTFTVNGYIISNLTVNGGFIYVSASGGTAIGNLINSSGRLYVCSGGTAIGNVINSNGTLYVGQGTAISNTISVGKLWTDYSTSARFTSTIIEQGGTANIHESCYMESTTVNSGGYIQLQGTAYMNSINPGGTFYVEYGGSAWPNTIASGGSLLTNNTGYIQSTTINSGGTLFINNSVAFSTQISCVSVTQMSGGVFNIHCASSAYIDGSGYYGNFRLQGYVARNFTINSGGLLHGGTALSLVLNGGTGVLRNGTSVQVNQGGYLSVIDSPVSSVTVASGGYVYNRGYVATITISEGGHLYPGHSGGFTLYGTATSVTQLSGGAIGAAVGVSNTFNSVIGSGYYGAFSVANRVASNFTIVSQGFLSVLLGGTAINLTQLSGGILTAHMGVGTKSTGSITSYYSTYIDGSGYYGSFHLQGSVASNFTIASGGLLDICSAGTATNITQLSGGGIGGTIRSSGTTVTYIDGSGYYGSFHAEGNVVSNFTLNAGASLGFYMGQVGTALSTTINSGGRLQLLYSGTVLSAVINSGGYISFGDLVTATSIIQNQGGVIACGSPISDTYIDGSGYYGSFHAQGGVVSNFTLNSGGSLGIYGITALSTTVNSGGYLSVSNGGTALSTTVNLGGCITIAGGGVRLISAKINCGGYCFVNSYSTAFAPVVKSSGTLVVSSLGTALNVSRETGAIVSSCSGAVITYV